MRIPKTHVSRFYSPDIIRIYRPQCMQHSTIDEDVSRSLTRAATHIASRSRREWHLRVRERTCDARLYLRIGIASRLVRTDTFCEDISGKGPKEGDSRRLNHPPVAGTPKPNAKDDKTQFELKTALLYNLPPLAPAQTMSAPRHLPRPFSSRS